MPSLGNFYKHLLLLPLFTENSASLSSFFEPLGDLASPVDLVMAFLAAGVTLNQTHHAIIPYHRHAAFQSTRKTRF